MAEHEQLPSKYAPQLARARARLTVSDEVGLALRAHRRALGLSQRSYAASRGLSRAMLARLEAGAGRMSLETVVDALAGTGFTLMVCLDPTPPRTSGAAVRVEPQAAPQAAGQSPEAAGHVPADAWPPTDLIARVRGGSRRFPAHREVQAVADPPLWWWIHEFFSGPTERPQWYAPEDPYDPFAGTKSPADDPTAGAA
jgi:hypothetical protein